MEGKRIFTPVIITLSFVSLLNDISSEMLYPVMPIFLGSIGFTAAWIGLLEGLAEAIAGLTKGYFGKLSDNIRKRTPFITAGYALSAISKSMLGLFTFPVWIFTARSLDKLGKGIRTSPRDALLADESDEKHRGKVFGFHKGMDTVGAAIGPVIALVFLSYFPERYQPLFLIAFMPAMLAVLLTLFIKQHRTLPKASQGKSKRFFAYLKYWGESTPQYRKLVATLFAFTLFNSSDFFLFLIAKQSGFNDRDIILAYIFYNLVFALASYPIGRLADRRGMKFSFALGLIFFVITYACLPFAKTPVQLFSIFFLYGIYAASSEGISKAWLSKVCDANQKATALGFYSGIASIVTFASSTLAGILWMSFGSNFVFAFSATGVTMILLYTLKYLR